MREVRLGIPLAVCVSNLVKERELFANESGLVGAFQGNPVGWRTACDRKCKLRFPALFGSVSTAEQARQETTRAVPKAAFFRQLRNNSPLPDLSSRPGSSASLGRWESRQGGA